MDVHSHATRWNEAFGQFQLGFYLGNLYAHPSAYLLVMFLKPYITSTYIKQSFYLLRCKLAATHVQTHYANYVYVSCHVHICERKMCHSPHSKEVAFWRKAAMDLHHLSLSEAKLSVLATQPNEALFSWILGAPARENVTVGRFPTNNDMVMLEKCQAQKC